MRMTETLVLRRALADSCIHAISGWYLSLRGRRRTGGAVACLVACVRACAGCAGVRAAVTVSRVVGSVRFVLSRVGTVSRVVASRSASFGPLTSRFHVTLPYMKDETNLM